ncbi:MAG: cation diffusion facilitator family transporter [Candidatus Eisenbacteria bacterium]
MHSHVSSQRALTIVLALNTLTFLVELGAGWWTNSLALWSDAGHMLGDVGAIALSLAAARLAARPPSPEKTWGWHRGEILAALVNGVTLVVIAALVAMEGVRRLGAPPAVSGTTVAVVAFAGLAVNLVSVAVLARGAGQDLNRRGAYLHAMSDVLGSLGALAAGIAMAQFGWWLADPLASLFIALLVFVAGIRHLRDTVHVLMEGAPATIQVGRLRAAMEGAEGVRAVHDLHVWSVTSRFAVLSAHVVTAPETTLADAQAVLARLRELLARDFAIKHATLQVEPEERVCDPCDVPLEKSGID